nr:nucleotidyltransferase family protein [uncultured Mediterraneibacter sp.]
MKITALIDEEEWLDNQLGNKRRGTVSSYESSEKSGRNVCSTIFHHIKEITNADTLLLVTSGNFTQQGRISACDKYEKAEYLKEQGADLVLELPVYCTLTTVDTFSFAAVSMLEKLNCIDEFVILCENAEENLLKETVQFLFIESGEYQKQIKKYWTEGMTFVQAQAKAVEQYIPGSEKILSSDLNRRAVEYAKAMKRMYSTMKLRFVDVEKIADAVDEPVSNNKISVTPELNTMLDEVTEKEVIDNAYLFRLSEEVVKLLSQFSSEQREKYLNEISGGYAPTTEKILAVYEETKNSDSEKFYEKLLKLLVNQSYQEEELKRYLLRVLIGVRHMEISICGLYSYALYIRVLGISENGEMAYERITQSSWIPVFKEESRDVVNEVIKSEKMDDSRKMLLELDRRAQGLYEEIS